MHNRKKPEAPPTEAETNALKEKSQMYKSLVTLIFNKRREKDYSTETMMIIGKVLRLNPDFYSLWNFRREILFHQLPELVTASSSQKIHNDEVRDLELQISAEGIKRNPKSYGAWQHRLWIVDRFETNFEHELLLCKEFLRQDQRNFHCWNYRRAVHERSGFPSSDEFDYSTEKIQENFSNYSAFHHRSVHLKDSTLSTPSLFEEELNIVENAIFTEPDDQSAWWYHQFLLTWVLNRIHSGDSTVSANWLAEIIIKQIEQVEGLLEVEAESRWAMNCIVYMIDVLQSPTVSTAISDEQKSIFSERRLALINHLITNDPIHKNRYLYILNNPTYRQ